MGFLRKTQPNVEEADPIPSPMRKTKSQEPASLK